MKLYHLTTNKAAKVIQKNGFKDNVRYCGIYDGITGEPKPLNGVFWADNVLRFLTNEDKGKKEEAPESVFVIDIPEKLTTDFEIVEEGKGYREWCIPAKLVNKYFADRKIHCRHEEFLCDNKPKRKISFKELGTMTMEEIIKVFK